MVSRYYAIKELSENGVNALPVTTEQLEAIIISKGFKIINYDVSCKKHAEILNNFGALQLAGRTKAFTYVSKQEKVVFISIGISANEKRLLLAHELGHIALNHVSGDSVIGYKPGGLIDDGQEDEANSFALEFLAPVCVLNRNHINSPQEVSALTLLDEKRSKLVADEVRNYKKPTEAEMNYCRKFAKSNKSCKNRRNKIILRTAIIIISVAVTFLSCVPLTRGISNISRSDFSSANLLTLTDCSEDTDYVVITKSGKKYHRPDCYYIANSKNIMQVTIEQARDGAYEPCKHCFSELYD